MRPPLASKPHHGLCRTARPTTASSDNEVLRHIEQIEQEHFAKYANQQLRGANITRGEYLPPELRRRVGRIIGLDAVDRPKRDANGEDDVAAVGGDLRKQSTEMDLNKPRTENKRFNESTITEILESDRTFEHIKLKIEPPPMPRKQTSKTVNWMAQFLRSSRPDRVKWPSKLYYLDRMFSQKNLFEQSEDMMDMAAEDFSDWLTELGNEKEVSITKEVIKQLFAISAEGEASKALTIMPTIRKAVPHEVAQGLGMPSFSIEHNVERLIASDLKKRIEFSKKTGFGRSLPRDMVVEKTGAENTVPMKPMFPKTLRSKSNVFKGITHLRSTKTLVQHIREDPSIPKPRFLVDKGCFDVDPSSNLESNNTDKPLYYYFQ